MADEEPLKGNNAQITSKILTMLATTRFSDHDKHIADDWLRAMMLVRLTGSDGYIAADELEWRSEYSEQDPTLVVRQGAGLRKADSFIADIVTEIFGDEVVETRVRQMFGAIDDDAYLALQWYLYNVLTNIEFYDVDDSIKADSLDDVDIDRWSRSYLRWYRTWLDESGR